MCQRETGPGKVGQEDDVVFQNKLEHQTKVDQREGPDPQPRAPGVLLGGLRDPESEQR